MSTGWSATVANATSRMQVYATAADRAGVIFGPGDMTYLLDQKCFQFWDGTAWQDLANEGQALPVGGAAGQVLTKTSSADYAAGWQTPATSANYVQLTSSGQTWQVPAGVTVAEFTVAQGGCGGGGGSGGSGGGGAAGMAVRFRFPVTVGEIYKANAIGAGGTGGPGGTSGTSAGGNGAVGGQTQLNRAGDNRVIGRSPLNQCFGGLGGTAATATYTNAGQYGGNPLFQTASYNVPSNPGSGGVGGYSYPAPTPFATLGGYGGNISQLGGAAQRPPGTPAQPGDPQPASYPYEEFPTARTGGGGNAGWGQLNGETATQPGCGGGGGGGWGTTAGSVGGNGGNGAPGFIEIRW